MAFCDFCPCDDCQKGRPDLYHKQTVDGKWICDVCWTYDLCTSDKNPFGVPRNPNGPCDDDPNCAHRPKMVDGPWILYAPTEEIQAT